MDPNLAATMAGSGWGALLWAEALLGALALALATGRLADRWSQELAGSVTVRVSAAAAEQGQRPDEQPGRDGDQQRPARQPRGGAGQCDRQHTGGGHRPPRRPASPLGRQLPTAPGGQRTGHTEQQPRAAVGPGDRDRRDDEERDAWAARVAAGLR